jgi:putative endonuclease
MAVHNEKGALGEQYACRFLEDRGYRILARNWRFGKDELDIIAGTAHELVIVEVKTRSNDQHGQPEEAVKKGKRRTMIRGANAYVAATPCELALRFDIVSVILHPAGKPYIHHITDAFYPTVHERPFK